MNLSGHASAGREAVLGIKAMDGPTWHDGWWSELEAGQWRDGQFYANARQTVGDFFDPGE